MKHALSVLLTVILLTSCSSEEEFVPSAGQPISTNTLALEVIYEGFGADVTRANYSGLSTTFDSGDRIGVYAVDGSGTVQANNILFTFDGSGWSSASTVLYKSTWTYYAYYPYVASPYTPDFSQSTVNTIFANFITDSSDKFHRADQSTLSNFTASDLMLAQGVSSSGKRVRFTMQHKKGLVRLSGDGKDYAPFTTNIPYNVGIYSYYLMKPSTATSVGGETCSAAGGKFIDCIYPLNPIDLSMVDNAGSPRAGRTTANCYLVHHAGPYKLPLVYGNAIRNGSTNRNAYYTTQTENTLQNFVNHNDEGIYTGDDEKDPWIKNHSITVAGARLIWQDVRGMISSVGIDGDYLTFTVDPDHIAPGNAVIAATTGADGTGDVVWSWHIWVTEETLANTTTIDTGYHVYEVAPVNVGWVPDNTYGSNPFYQWGRKDPMTPSNGIGNQSHDTWAIDGTQLTSSTNTSCYSMIDGAHSIGETIQNPISFYNDGPYNETKYNYWDAENTTLDNSNSTSRSVATVKTVYDPCPPDFCVPTSNCFYYIYSNYSSYFPWSSTPAGRTWNKNGASVFFPASGYRYFGSGILSGVGSYGYYWAATPCSTSNGRSIYFNSGSTYWLNFSRASGFPVRAVAEEY